ncbi:outer membrane protein transport protein, partial [Acinetobacter baumannii]
VSGLLNALKGTPLGTPLLSPVTGILAGAAVDDTSTASATVDTFGFGYGWNIGYMYQFSDKTRLGISYRSESDIRMNGKLDWDLT